jgi:membrane-associated phospholipid phosphatase
VSAGLRPALLVLALTWPLQPVDDAVRAWVQAHRTPALEAPMRFASGRSRIVLLAGGVAALFTVPGRAFVLETVVALVPVNAAVESLKWCVGRTRPDGDTHRRNSSFPSSHAANAFTVAAVITRRWRRAAIPAWLAALTVAWSRMYLDSHRLSDVLFALALGVGGAWLAGWIMRRMLRRKSPNAPVPAA